MRVPLFLAARRLATAIMSQGMSVRRLLLFAGALVALPVLASQLDSEWGGWLLISAGVVGFIYCVWKRPAFAAFLVLYLAARTGGAPLLIAAPLTVMLARRDIRRRLEIPQSVSRTIFTLAAALVAFLVTLMYADLSFGSASASGGTSTATTAQPAFGQGGENIVQRIMRALGFGSGEGSGRPVELRPAAPPPPDDPDGWPWLLLLLIAVALAVVGVLLYRLWSRRRQVDGDVPGARARALARLEAVGHSVGRTRAPNEGALTYASALADHTGDARLGQAGDLVSSAVYESSSADPVVVDHNLSGIESDPPERPPKPPLGRRLRARLAASSITPKGAVLGVSGVVLLGVAGWKVAPHLGDLSSEPDAFASGPLSEPPDEWGWLHEVPADELEAWQVCAASQGDYVVEEAIAGVVHLDEPVAASARTERYSYADSPVTELTVRRGDTEFRRYGDAFAQAWLETSAWQLPLRSFESVDGVADDLHVRDAVRSTGIDRFGGRYVRFESLPVRYEDSFSEQTAPRVGLPVTDVVWVLDVWAGADGRPSRVRVMTQEPAWRWAEWRRVEPGALDRLIAPSCPIDAPYTDRVGWVGSEPWTPTLVAPPLIDYDANGNPLDIEPWETSQPLERGERAIGAIAGPVRSLTFADAYEGVPQGLSGGHAPTVDVDWTADAQVSIIDVDYWPAATLIEQDAVVAEWRMIADIGIYESALAITRSPDLVVDPDAWWDEIDRFWDAGRDLLGIELDRRPGLDAYLVSISDATEIVGGYDRAGELVALLVRDTYVEWRRLELPGQPPRSVLEREAELRDCLAGTRPFGPDGRCLE